MAPEMVHTVETAETARTWLDSLNPAQREAVTADGGGPLLVVAGAGTGKTWTLACRVAFLLEQGVAPERILLLTFTRRAARDMLGRAERISGQAHAGRVWGGTFHAVGNRLLRLYGQAISLRPDFTVLDQGDAADLMGLLREDLGLAKRERRFPRKETLADIYTRTVNAGAPLQAVLSKHYPWCADDLDAIRQVFQGYTERKRASNVLDYDDLLLYWRVLAEMPDAGDRLSERFEHLLVDEYQDTNSLQADILRAMRRRKPGISVVGDDAQAIYSFRSATARNILDFPLQFPGARLIKLERNYRSTQPILHASNAVIAQARERHEKTLWTDRLTGTRPRLITCEDEANQSAAVCRQVLADREAGIALRQQAVLVRAAHYSDQLEIELTRRNIPFVKYGGLKFLEAAHVKDVLALLRVLENPHDEVAWFRVLQLLEGIGPASARKLMIEIGVGQGHGASPLRALLDQPLGVPPAARDDLDRLRALLAGCAVAPGTPEPPPAAQIQRVRQFCEPIFTRVYARAASRLADVEQLEALAADAPTRGRFLADLTLDPPVSTGDLAGPPLLDEDYLVLSTVHSAKGGEWEVVHLIHAVDGVIPSDMATGDEEQIEEERRLMYVALTRARRELYVYAPLRYYHAGRRTDAHSYAQISRFLTPDVQAHFDRSGSVEPPASEAPTTSRAAADRVDALLKNLWG